MKYICQPTESFPHQYRTEGSFPAIQEHYATNTIPSPYSRDHLLFSPSTELKYVFEGGKWDVYACGLRKNVYWYLIPIPFPWLSRYVVCCRFLITQSESFHWERARSQVKISFRCVFTYTAGISSHSRFVPMPLIFSYPSEQYKDPPHT